MGEHTAIPVVQIDRFTGKVVGKYPDVNAAATATKVGHSAIKRCIGSKRYGEGQAQAGGYIWMKQEHYDIVTGRG